MAVGRNKCAGRSGRFQLELERNKQPATEDDEIHDWAANVLWSQINTPANIQTCVFVVEMRPMCRHSSGRVRIASLDSSEQLFADIPVTNETNDHSNRATLNSPSIRAIRRHLNVSVVLARLVICCQSFICVISDNHNTRPSEDRQRLINPITVEGQQDNRSPVNQRTQHTTCLRRRAESPSMRAQRASTT